MKQSISDIIAAFRLGTSVPNPTPMKWFGLLCTVLALLICILTTWAVTMGWLDRPVSVSEGIFVATTILAPLLGSAVSQITSTEKIGILPPK